MCSILSAIDLRPGTDLTTLRPLALSLSALQRHRGPDWSGVYQHSNALLVHERLAIVDPAGGAQPLLSKDGFLALAVNGEIYNHRPLRDVLSAQYAFQSHSDCEVINALYASNPDSDTEAWLMRLNGMFGFTLWDAKRSRAIIARDHIGIVPLYWGHDAENRLWVASEMKALAQICADVAQFPPGHWFDTATGCLQKYYQRPWREVGNTRGVEVSPEELRESFEAAVHRQLMSDVP